MNDERFMVDALMGNSNLTSWEEEFIDSIDERLNLFRELTETQREKLVQIFDERASHNRYGERRRW